MNIFVDSLLKEGGHKQSDIARAIGVTRQLISYVIAGKRELSLSLALKLESYFNLPKGKLLKTQAENSVAGYKQRLKNELGVSILNIKQHA